MACSFSPPHITYLLGEVISVLLDYILVPFALAFFILMPLRTWVVQWAERQTVEVKEAEKCTVRYCKVVRLQRSLVQICPLAHTMCTACTGMCVG